MKKDIWYFRIISKSEGRRYPFSLRSYWCLLHRMGFWNLLVCVILANLAACSALPISRATPTMAPENGLAEATTTLIASSTAMPAPTLVLAEPELAVDHPAPVGVELPAIASDPLRFSFPTPRPAPVSAWRPPLYPTPWAPTLYDHFFFARPIAAKEINWPLADYRYGGVFLPEVVHTGIDIPAATGTTVLAAGSGRVTWAGYGLYRGEFDTTDPYGLAVAIKHDFGFQGETLYTVYGHLSRIDVMLGQQVQAGEAIGLTGETGNVTGPHLHFEVRMGRNNYFVSRNPELWLAPPQGWGILVARITDSLGDPLDSTDVKVIDRNSGQTWIVRTYGKGTVNSDPYYQENMVLGDLPAGDYTIWIQHSGATYNLDIRIDPGLVTYFTFKGKRGFKTGLPPTPAAGFATPLPYTSTP
jgi:murein DD-endopeptidase MepM/ murein hydrolase activator NlpD